MLDKELLMTARDEMDELLDALVGFAKKMLVARSAFYPFGAELTTDGRVQMVAADLDEAQPSPEQVVGGLHERLRRDADEGEIRAAGICLDVRLQPDGDQPSDAIRVDVEHSDSDPVRVFLPYVVELPGRVVFGELVAEPGRSNVFTSGEGRE
jgi:hypothetical protein